MDANQLPTDPDELRRLLLSAQQALGASEQALKLKEQSLAIAQEQNKLLASTISEQQQKLEQKEQMILELLRALRGKQRERVNPDQLLLFEIGELESMIKQEAQQEEEATTSKPRKKKGHGRRLIPDGLHEEIVLHELPESERLCPHDGQPMPVIRWEESKQLDFVPSKLKVIVHRRAVYACSTKHDEATIITAPRPPEPIEKGLASAGLLAHVIVSKFGDHLPGYRMEDIFARYRIDIHRSTLYDWMSQVADLCLPLYEVMKQRVLQSKVIHTDDTKVKLIDHLIRGTRLARFWGYLGDASNPYAVYDFTEDRTRTGPQKFLESFRGYLQADAYAGYDEIYKRSKKPPPNKSPKNEPDINENEPMPKIEGVIEVACWTHCRRYWHKARDQDSQRAHYAIAIINRLYEIERACADKSSEFRQAKRAEHAVPLLTQLEKWLEQEKFLPKSKIGKAATYTRNQWVALNRYVQDGDLSIDNNFAERAMRPIAIGRKNWLFVGSNAAGKRAGVLMSLVASCKVNHVEPHAYIKDLLTCLAHKPATDELLQLLPDQWLQSHPEHRWLIADRRKADRQRKQS